MNRDDVPLVTILTHSKPIWFQTCRYDLGTKTGHTDNFTEEMRKKFKKTAVQA